MTFEHTSKMKDVQTNNNSIITPMKSYTKQRVCTSTRCYTMPSPYVVSSKNNNK
jgi:hypothetical protein